MAELHEELIRKFRKKIIKKGFKENKSPMPHYRPDFFGRRYSSTSEVIEEIVIEAEIASTLFYEHTTEQLIKMGEYIALRKRQKIRISGYLLIPKNREIFSLANALLGSLPDHTKNIKILQM